MYTGANWKLASSSYYALELDPSSNFSGVVSGQLYDATNTDPDALAWEKEVKNCDAGCGFYGGDQSFLTYYDKALHASGYDTSPLNLDQNFNVTTSNSPAYILYPLSGDGPMGTSNGYIDYDNNGNIRVVIISSEVAQNQVFISNILNLKALLTGL